MNTPLRRSLVRLVVVAFAVLGPSATAHAASFTVNDTNDYPLATPSSTTCASTHATCTLRAAVQAADNAGGSNSISLPAGDYKLAIAAAGPNTSADPATGDLDVTGSGSLTITGTGSGATTIDANQIDRAFAVKSGAGLTLAGMTIENGSPSPNSTGQQGGGAIYSDGALTLTGDVTLQQNTNPNTTGGGAIYDDSDGSVSITGAIFSHNSAPNASGGAVYDGESTGATSINQTTFSHNSSGGGGALWMGEDGAATLTASTFTSNTATGAGGAIDTQGSSVTISGSTFTSNQATAAGAGAGGAIVDSLNPGFTLTLTGDSFDSNTADQGGGLYYLNGDLAASGNTFSTNSASTSGGAVYDESGAAATLRNNTFDGNSAPTGGALANNSGPTAVTVFENNTVARNRGTGGRGGGIAFPGNSSTTGSSFANNIVADNSGGDCSTGAAATPLTSSQDPGNNLDSDSSCFGGAINAGDKPGVDPKLGPLADNGGPTLTDALLPGSPAIDAGNDAKCPTTDQRGAPRPQGAHCDIGAFEVAPAKLALSKTAPASATAGMPFSYTITVSNSGAGPSTGTSVTDQLPANSVLYGVNPSQGSCAASGSPVTLTCNLGTLDVHRSATVTIAVAISKAGQVTNSATASNDQGSSAHASATTTVKKPKPAGSKPTATTGGSKAAGKHRERVFGRVNPGAQPTVYFFQYGTSRGYGLFTKFKRTTGATIKVKELLANLTPGVRYHYRLVAINDSGISLGKDRTFRIRRHKHKK